MATTSVKINSGAVEAHDYASQVPRSEWSNLIGARRSFCRVSIPSDCRNLLRFVDEAVQFKMWEHVGCTDLPTFIREHLELDPDLVEWARIGLKTMKPDEPVPYAKAVEVGKLRPKAGRPPKDEADNSGNHQNLGGEGTTVAYTLARLRRDDPEMAARVERGELTANAAAVAKGWRKPPDLVQQMRRLWDAASEEQRAEFGSYIAPVERPKWKRPKPPEFPLFMDSSKDHPVGSTEWAGRISIRAYHEFERLDGDLQHLVKTLKMAVPGKPWLAWPKDKPWGTIDVWSKLMFGRPWASMIDLAEQIDPDAARELRQASR